MRNVPEWVAKNDNEKIPMRVRLRVFRRYDGHCTCGCNLRIRGSDWQIEHERAICNGGEHRESNLRPILRAHHAAKTADDVAAKAKSDASARRHFGIKPQRRHDGWHRTFLTNKDGPFRKKLNGKIERR